MLKLKLQYFEHLIWRAHSLEKTLMLGKTEGRRQRMRWLDGITDSVDVKVTVKSLHHVWLFATPWTVVCQSPPSMGFPRQEYWSGLPFPSPGDLPNPGIKPGSPTLQVDSLLSETPVDMSLSKLQEIVKDKGGGHKESDTTERRNNNKLCALPLPDSH